MQPVYCVNCGKSNESNAKFCNECASPLFYARPVVPAETPKFIDEIPPDPNSSGYKFGAWWAKETTESKFLLGGVGVLAVLVFIGLLFGGQMPRQQEQSKPTTVTTPAPPPARTELNASVRFNGTQFIITNNESVDLTNVKMEINGGLFSGGYELKHNKMKAKDTYTVGAMQFADSDGTRFNPFQMKPKKFTISADSNIGHLFYVGGWD